MKWYRYHAQRYAPPCDEYGDSVGRGRLELECHEFDVIKETSGGVFINVSNDAGGWTFVLKKPGKKRFAHATKVEALDAFVRRKDRHILILESQLRDAKEARQMAKDQLNARS